MAPLSWLKSAEAHAEPINEHYAIELAKAAQRTREAHHNGFLFQDRAAHSTIQPPQTLRYSQVSDPEKWSLEGISEIQSGPSPASVRFRGQTWRAHGSSEAGRYFTGELL